MNRYDDGPDHGWVDPEGTDLLTRTLGALAGGVDPASPTGPAAAVPAMSSRVRRRRTAKLGGLGGGALALAGALVLGAAQLAPPDAAELLPATPDFEVQEGYQPPWLGWSDLTCGMPVADLESTAPGWSVAPAGDIYAHSAELRGDSSRVWGMATTYEQGEGSLDTPPVLVWSKDGVVLDLGPNVFEGWDGQADPLVGTGRDAITARGSSMTTCVPGSYGGDLQHETPLPHGDYEVRVVAFPQVASGSRATVVSDPVPVRLDAAGAHSPGEPHPGGSAVEFPEPAQGQVSRFELDRSTDWFTADMTQRDFSSDTPMRVIGRCAGADPETVVRAELILPSTGEVLEATSITCDGDEAGSAVGVLSEHRSGETIDIRVPNVSDDVARLWISLEPETPADGDGLPECSATGFEPDYAAGLDDLTQSTSATAGNIMVLAQVCNSEALVALAKQHGVELMSGTQTPEETFALPESDPGRYLRLAALVSNTTPAFPEGGAPDAVVVWPRVVTDEFRDSDEAWAELVTAGVLTQGQADAQRADGYHGPRVGITTDGDWLYYTTGPAGD
ncbi:hypothetical protein ACIG47_02810 [Promicromonospora sp. NPDC052451]|uniref:hypothetical protein n=1 Tax=Promicromonospora sp. NPDC052451 TaxID=3364407 RepID=UPI0037CA55DA